MESSKNQLSQTPNTPVSGVVSGGQPAAKSGMARWWPWIASAASAIAVFMAIMLWFLYNGGSLGQLASGEELPAAAVSISTQEFLPATIKIKKGDRVTWTNQDHQMHQVVGDQVGLALNSQEALAQGDTYTYTFDKSGTYSYHDPLYPIKFKGTVIVE